MIVFPPRMYLQLALFECNINKITHILSQSLYYYFFYRKPRKSVLGPALVQTIVETGFQMFLDVYCCSKDYKLKFEQLVFLLCRNDCFLSEKGNNKDNYTIH